MNLTKTTLLLLLFHCTFFSTAQTGPWAKYDQELKDGALYREASAGNLNEVKSIVAGGGNIHFVFKQTKYTILMAAAGSGKIEVVRYLLDLGVDPTAKDWWEQTAIDKARSVGAKDIEALLTAAMGGTKPPPASKPEPAKEKPVTTPVILPKQPETTKPEQGGKWPSFSTYKVGDSVLYWAITGWRPGVIREVGVKEATGKISVDFSHKKYLVDPDAYALGNEWMEWSSVVKRSRQAFWTAWFVGEWAIGEVQAHSNEIKGSKETDTYYYMDATEMLQVFANQTYRWKLIDGKIKTGKWIPVPNEPGIILQKGYRDMDWTLRNATGVFDWQIRKLDMINLKPSANVMSINGKRKSTE